MHADVSAVSVKREAHDVTECSHDDLSTTTYGEFTNTNFIKTTKKFFTFDVSTSIRGLHQKKLVLSLLLPVLGAIS